MATLDVSDAFDESFLSTLTVYKCTVDLDDEGFWSKTLSDPYIIRVVKTPNEDKPKTDIQSDYKLKSIEVYSIDKLRNQNAIDAADIIEWNGQKYQVDSVEDYSNYGQGYYHIYASLINAEDRIPADEPEEITEDELADDIQEGD